MPLPFRSMNVLVQICVCQVNTGESKFTVCPPATFTGLEDPSMIRSSHWSPTTSDQLPSGTPVNVKLPLASHLVKAKVSPSRSPRLAQHVVWANAWLFRGSPRGKTELSNRVSFGARDMCRLLTCPLTVLAQGTAGGPLQKLALRALTMAGLTMPMNTCHAPGPNSWK